jgi:glycosyltransferase involved in cell wall biosynthesis
MKYSIIIPTYNHSSDLQRAIQSVIDQTYRHWECIIVDNHSTDNTDAVIHDFNDARIKLHKIHNHGVIAASRNMGIRQAQGEYIAFLDSDDRWAPEKLAKSIEILENGADVVYHDMWRVSKNNQRLFFRRVHTRALTAPVFDDLIINGNALINSSVVIRTSFVQQVGGLVDDSELIAVEDFDCWLRVAKLTEHFVRVPEVLGYYWVGGGNVSHNPQLALVNLKRLQAIYLSSLDTASPKKLPIWWQYSLARAHYLLNERTQAKQLLRQLVKRRLSLSLQLKSYFMLLLG